MHPLQLLLISCLAVLTAAQGNETVYGVYIFHRHGDRTPKSLPPANLTALGYQQILNSGQTFRARYVSSNATSKLQNLSPDIAIASQLTVTAPLDTVLQDSAQAFLQALYPPVAGRSETLRNGTVVPAPMSGYQLVPVGLTTSGSGSEDNGWLQDASGCKNAAVSSNNYFLSAEYTQLQAATHDFYARLQPVINGTFAADAASFKNAYTIFDLITVATIHNATIPSSTLLDPPTLLQLRTLADAHEWGLAYNATDDVRALPGMQLAGEISTFLNASISGPKAPRLGIQFGAYASFLSFFGLAGLPAASADFRGIPDYGSAMVLELVGPTAAAGVPATPKPEDLQVRFLFRNGSEAELKPFPLFGGQEASVPWTAFRDGVAGFAVSTTQEWCGVCGNTTGVCAAYANSSGPSTSSSSASAEGGKARGMSAAVGGVIGACVALAVVLGVEALVVLLGGFRFARKRSQAQVSSVSNVGSAAKA